jgi:DHA2 family multidrug resistance protein
MLSLAVGSLQLMLDRGEQLDWFSSLEIMIELGLAIAAAWIFVVHTATDREPFLEAALFVDRNFSAALVLIFMVGIILLATMALLPPMLQTLMNYPIITVGIILAPRGIGTMLSMFVVGRLVRIIDPRLLVLFGLAATAYSLWQMTAFSLEMDSWPVIISGVVQGFGLGFVFIPLSTVAFQTLDQRLRTEATGLFNLVRNLGSSVGVSIMAALLSSNMQVNHATLAARITPFNPAVMAVTGLPPAVLATPLGAQRAAEIEGMIQQQAGIISYINDYKLMFLITLAAMPLLLLIRYRKPQPGAAMPSAAAAMAD